LCFSLLCWVLGFRILFNMEGIEGLKLLLAPTPIHGSSDSAPSSFRATQASLITPPSSPPPSARGLSSSASSSGISSSATPSASTNHKIGSHSHSSLEDKPHHLPTPSSSSSSALSSSIEQKNRRRSTSALGPASGLPPLTIPMSLSLTSSSGSVPPGSVSPRSARRSYDLSKMITLDKNASK
jgi:hypothetical protein